jgi:hypothetical protein
MDTPHSKITHAVEQHLSAAADIIAQKHDPEAARARLVNAVLEAFGDDAQLRKLVDLLLQAMYAQRGADLRECMGFGRADEPWCPAMRRTSPRDDDY